MSGPAALLRPASAGRTDRHPLEGKAGLADGPAGIPCLGDAYAQLSPEALLAHFRSGSGAVYFPLKPGKPKHVESADRVLRGEFRLNNETHVLAEGFDWLANPSRDREWLILLHKFYYSRDLALAFRATGDQAYARYWVRLVESWMAQVPDGFVNSQVTGRRLQQWILAYRYFVPGGHCDAIGPGFLLAWLRSIQSQALFLKENLSPEGNHRTIELYGIFSVAVLFPELRESAGLLEFALRELLENLCRDFLPDGVQKELSTDYHHTVLKNFLRVRELADLNGVRLPDGFHRRMRLALDFSLWAHKPDGFLPAINDGDANSYLSLLKTALRFYPDEALRYVLSRGEEGVAPVERSRVFPDSGYCVLRSPWSERPYRDGRYCFFDCGPLGFGSHGHYDLLNVELAAYGRSLVVDPGRYTYFDGEGPDGINWRHAFKGTAAHNTVLVDGEDQIEYRGGPPVGAQPKAKLLEFRSMPGFDFVEGLARSPQYPVEHRRSLYFAEGRYWIIADRLAGEGKHRYEQRFHLGPEALAETRRLAGSQTVQAPNLLILQAADAAVDLTIETGFVSPEYGIKLAAPVIRYSQAAEGSARFVTLLYPYPDRAPDIRVQAMPVFGAGGNRADHLALALRMDIREEEGAFIDLYFQAFEPGPADFRCGDLSGRARLLFLRRSAAGEILSLQAEGLEQLGIAGSTVVDRFGDGLCLSSRGGRLYLQSAGGHQPEELPGPGGIVAQLATLNKRSVRR